MKKHLAIASTVAASMLGGGALGAAFLTPSAATAATDSSTSTAASTTARPTPPWVTDALKKLVDANTITQAQADAVADALQAAQPAGGPGGPGGPGMHGAGPGLSVAAKTIGVTESALRDAITGGQTIADVAKAHNVEVQKVIDALVADMKAHLAADVTSGRLTQAQADERAADAAQHATDLVNGGASAATGGERSA